MPVKISISRCRLRQKQPSTSVAAEGSVLLNLNAMGVPGRCNMPAVNDNWAAAWGPATGRPGSPRYRFVLRIA
jgi:hypothetical protein